MKPLLQDVELLMKGSIYVKEIKTTKLNDQFHFHNVHEIALILKGNGKRIVGDHIEYFTDGDLIFIGSLLPHASYSGEDYTSAESSQEIHALVIYFNPDWFNKNLLSSHEFLKFNALMKKIERGIQIMGNTKAKTIKAIQKLEKSRGLERIIKLCEILDTVSKSNEYSYLASEGYSNSHAQVDVERLGNVYKFIMKNFTNIIKLEEVSSIANMTPTSFCKYFKSKTGKTFSNLVNELRIGQACKLFVDANLSVSDVCYHVGFNNLTNFNKTFKQFLKMTPTEYKKAFISNN
jgi:AraC-like DNA-binding protein